VNGNGPFDPRKEAPLLSAYVDGELSPEDAARVEAHLAENADTRRQVAELRRLKSMTDALRLKEPPPEEWETFWNGVYNRTERSLGWMLLVLGLVVIGGWAILQLLTALWVTDDLPLFIKGAVVVGAGGLLLLLISVIRERVYKRSRTRYKDVVR
jgi:predicted anti-sigma-YlaC factor YlaD